MIKYVTLKDTKVAYQVTRKGLRYHIKTAYFLGGKAVLVKTVKKFSGVKTYLKLMIEREQRLGVELGEIVVYNYTGKDLEFEGTQYYRLDNKLIKHFER
jgi:hypothetical protein